MQFCHLFWKHETDRQSLKHYLVQQLSHESYHYSLTKPLDLDYPLTVFITAFLDLEFIG